jgi:hypothetical protein
VQDRALLRRTCIEKTNTFEIDEIQFLQIQKQLAIRKRFDLAFDLIQVPKSKFAAQPNPPLDAFNPQRHLPTSSGRRRSAVQVGLASPS